VPLLLAGTLLACPKEKEAVKPTPKPSPPSPTTAATPTPAPSASVEPARDDESDREEACLDRWLAERKLDRYGSPEGAMYAGGTPLFDETTGRQTPRRDYVYARHPEARAACAPKPRR
jgi:hypothetical protein